MIELERAPDLKAAIASAMSFSVSIPTIDGMPVVAAVEAMAGRAHRGELGAALIGLPPQPPSALRVTNRLTVNRKRDAVTPSSSDNELVCQRNNAAAVLLPDELKPAAFRGAQVELEIRVGGNGLVQIGD